MKLNRRDFLLGTGALLASCGQPARRSAGRQTTNGAGSGDTPQTKARPHYLVLVTLRGGFDAVMSVDPKDQSVVGTNIHCGYRPEQRIESSSGRLYGPLAKGLVRHDSDLCLLHGVRSDTTDHVTGLQMMMRGARGLRPGPLAPVLAKSLQGDAPIPVLNMLALSGSVEFEDGVRPAWAGLRADMHKKQSAHFAGNEAVQVQQAAMKTAGLETFLDYTNRDHEVLKAKFTGELGEHFRYAFQAIRGNWAKCIQIGSRLLRFDSHSDNDRYQQELLPTTFEDLAVFIDLLKNTKNSHGRLFDQTTVVAFSELGRYPKLNGENGKDHWPENSWIVAGAGVQGGVTVGGTSDTQIGSPVDFQSGKPKALEDGGRPLFIDDAFATITKLCGTAPATRGYGNSELLNCILS